MLPEKGIQIVLSDEVSEQLGQQVITRSIQHSSDDDIMLYQISCDYDLDIPFQDIANYTLDYAMQGHVAMFFDKDMMVLSLPSFLSCYQKNYLQQVKGQFCQNHFIIYACDQKQSFELFDSFDQVISLLELTPSFSLQKKRNQDKFC